MQVQFKYPITSETAPAGIPYLPYLEGMRGVLALYVVLFHIRELLDPNFSETGPTGALLPGHGTYLFYGNAAVAVFIVISGYVLTIPVAIRGSLGDFWKFMRRRARRLLPAYYAALALSVPFFMVWLRQKHQLMTTKHLIEQILAHVFLVQDLSNHTIHSVNGPMWTIAVEWQIYIAFALLLLPLQRSAGLLAATAAAFAIGLLPTLVGTLTHTSPYALQGAHFWYFGLFALGSAAAWIAYGSQTIARSRFKVPWKVVSIVAAIAFVITLAPTYGVAEPSITPLADIELGLAVASGFLAIAQDEKSGKRSIVASIFSSRPIIWLGTFSYSLYLIHFPLVQVLMYNAPRFAPPTRLWLGLGTLLLMIALAYGFARLFEFPFLSSYRKTHEDQALLRASRL